MEKDNWPNFRFFHKSQLHAGPERSSSWKLADQNSLPDTPSEGPETETNTYQVYPGKPWDPNPHEWTGQHFSLRKSQNDILHRRQYYDEETDHTDHAEIPIRSRQNQSPLPPIRKRYKFSRGSNQNSIDILHHSYRRVKSQVLEKKYKNRLRRNYDENHNKTEEIGDSYDEEYEIKRVSSDGYYGVTIPKNSNGQEVNVYPLEHDIPPTPPSSQPKRLYSSGLRKKKSPAVPPSRSRSQPRQENFLHRETRTPESLPQTNSGSRKYRGENIVRREQITHQSPGERTYVTDGSGYTIEHFLSNGDIDSNDKDIDIVEENTVCVKCMRRKRKQRIHRKLWFVYVLAIFFGLGLIAVIIYVTAGEAIRLREEACARGMIIIAPSVGSNAN